MTWLRNLGHSPKVSAALDDLKRVAEAHHHSIASVNLAMTRKALLILETNAACAQFSSFENFVPLIRFPSRA